MRLAVAHGLDELVDDVLGRGAVGVAHAEIDDVAAGRPGRGLHLVDLGEDVGRQPPDPVELGLSHPLTRAQHSAGPNGERRSRATLFACPLARPAART